MALRPVSELGLSDATDVGREDTRRARPRSNPRRPSSPTDQAVHRRRASATRDPTASKLGTSDPRIAIERSAVLLADEPSVFVQIMVPGELHERLADTSHALGAEHRKLRHQKTILGALVWRYIQPDDAERLRELGAWLDAYLKTDIAEAPDEIKVGAHLPFSLKYRLDGAALALRRTRRAASAKTLLSAVVWRHVDAAEIAELVELLAAYREISLPEPRPLP